jgi:hypothetical protein
MMSASYRFFIRHLKGTERAGLRADPAVHAAVIHGEEGIDELEGALGADRDAGPAVAAALPVYHKHGDHIVTGFPLIFTHGGHSPPPKGETDERYGKMEKRSLVLPEVPVVIVLLQELADLL